MYFTHEGSSELANQEEITAIPA